jgi:hypothetical protein
MKMKTLDTIVVIVLINMGLMSLGAIIADMHMK